ncbi:MAG TPA: hypothetical protein VHU18_04085 [Rhizomicrobium sp.]|jgi:hypothetical protein|nr:hypothetical protein [Rhizomicrobium sp.]
MKATFAITAALLAISTAANASERCSLASLRGNYGLYGQGTVFIGTPQQGLEVDSGTAISDGRGNIKGITNFTLNGAFYQVTYTATYTVGPDCTFTAVVQDSLGETLHEVGMVFGGGAELRFIETDPGAAIERVVRRLGD